MENKILYGVICILLNQWGIPAFIQGQTKTALVQLVTGIIPPFAFIFAPINMVYGILLAIDIFQMSDEDFKAKQKSLVASFPNVK